MDHVTIYFWFLLPFITSWLVLRAIRATRTRYLSQLWNCKPMRSLDRHDIFGWKTLQGLRTARKEHRLLVQIGQDMDEVGKNCHTVQNRVLWSNTIMTRDPENLKTVLTTKVSHYEFDVARSKILSALVGPSVLTVEGAVWKHSRSIIRPQFSRESISNLPLFERHVGELFRKLNFGSDGWTGDIELQSLFFNMTLDVTTEFLYGQSVHSQNPEAQAELKRVWGVKAPNIAGFGEAFDGAVQWAASMSILGIVGFWLFPLSGRLRSNRSQYRGVAEWSITQALGETAEGKQPGKLNAPRSILLDELAKITHDKDWLRNETLGLLLAGRNTTAMLLGWLFYYLAREPEIYQKLRAVILDDFGDDPESGHINIASLLACQYLQHSLSEALRLGTPIPSIARRAAEDTTLPKGGGLNGDDPVFVAKGTPVLCNVFLMHHCQDIWGKDVEKFRPERWENRERNWEFTAFGGGPRACIGRQSHHYLLTL
ncbi:MAG: hypothetical protein Q9218_001035 [Villophora microphyllina]